MKWPGEIPAIFLSVIARSVSDEAIHLSLRGAMDCFAIARNDVDGISASRRVGKGALAPCPPSGFATN
jgi:hypothetical protein